MDLVDELLRIFLNLRNMTSEELILVKSLSVEVARPIFGFMKHNLPIVLGLYGWSQHLESIPKTLH